jgi:alpha/beta superfamily hydrolase
MTGKRIEFPCGELSLEGMLHIPDGKGPFAAVIICHPHPLYGGMMDNNIVIAVCQALTQTSTACLRFNFRGVGESQGIHDNGAGEQDDVVAALSYVSSIKEIDNKRIGLCGYSFGAGVALDVAVKSKLVNALALISPILPHDSPIDSYTKPKLLLWGSDDLALPAVDLKRFTEELPEPKQYKVISGADHLWWGYEDKVGSRVAYFFAEALGTSL